MIVMKVSHWCLEDAFCIHLTAFSKTSSKCISFLCNVILKEIENYHLNWEAEGMLPIINIICKPLGPLCRVSNSTLLYSWTHTLCSIYLSCLPLETCDPHSHITEHVYYLILIFARTLASYNARERVAKLKSAKVWFDHRDTYSHQFL